MKLKQSFGFLDHLCAGDEVMRDRGFTIRDLLKELKVCWITSAFMRKKCQLTNKQIH